MQVSIFSLEPVELPDLGSDFQFTAYTDNFDKHMDRLFCTVGDIKSWQRYDDLALHLRAKWLHYDKISDITAEHLMYCHLTANKHEAILFSVISASYNTRLYTQLMNQTYGNWEWIIGGDCPVSDARIRCLPDGNKKMLAAYSRGHYIVDVDANLDSDSLQLVLDADADAYVSNFIAWRSTSYHHLQGYDDLDMGQKYELLERMREHGDKIVQLCPCEPTLSELFRKTVKYIHSG